MQRLAIERQHGGVDIQRLEPRLFIEDFLTPIAQITQIYADFFAKTCSKNLRSSAKSAQSASKHPPNRRVSRFGRCR